MATPAMTCGKKSAVRKPVMPRSLCLDSAAVSTSPIEIGTSA
jgi:hypothetical protein